MTMTFDICIACIKTHTLFGQVARLTFSSEDLCKENRLNATGS